MNRDPNPGLSVFFVTESCFRPCKTPNLDVCWTVHRSGFCLLIGLNGSGRFLFQPFKHSMINPLAVPLVLKLNDP